MVPHEEWWGFEDPPYDVAVQALGGRPSIPEGYRRMRPMEPVTVTSRCIDDQGTWCLPPPYKLGHPVGTVGFYIVKLDDPELERFWSLD